MERSCQSISPAISKMFQYTFEDKRTYISEFDCCVSFIILDMKSS